MTEIIGSFGNWTASNNVSITDDINYGTYFKMPYAGSVNSITAKIFVEAGHEDWSQCGIYNYAPGALSLKGVTGSVYITNTSSYNQQFTFATSLGLPAGSYVLCYNSKSFINYIGYTNVTNRSAEMNDTFPISVTPWTNGTADFTLDELYAINANYTYSGTLPSSTNLKINIGDAWATATAKINIGDSWKNVVIKTNIADNWR
jgi:hypothetical protein